MGNVQISDTQVLAALERLRRVSGGNARPVMSAIARYMKTSTQLRFRNQTSPEGHRWPPSQRARRQGGQTLRDTNRLYRSISSSSGPHHAEVGTNVVYGAAHQFGVRRVVNVGAHRRQMTGQSRGRSWAKSVPVKSFSRMLFLPKRPFLGFSQADRAEILDILREHIESFAAR